MRSQKITATLDGSNGSATGDATSATPLSGKLYAIYIDITTGSQPNTTDVTVTTAGNDNCKAQTLLTATNVSSSAWYYPTHPVQDATGAAVSFDGTHGIVGLFPVNDYIKVHGAQGNAGALIVYVMVDDD